jgi:organic radical activating enzyme
MSNIICKFVVEEDFVNYKKPCMFIGFPLCDYKCGKENCQNACLEQEPPITVNTKAIARRYLMNMITKAVVIGGMEPFLNYQELLILISDFRQKTHDPIIIYTGYEEEELKDHIEELKKFNNIIIKFGRYLPNQNSIYDEILGVVLASNNQYAKQIS